MLKEAEFVGYMFIHGERVNEWRCSNKKCGMSVSEDYICCPYCGRKIKFFNPAERENESLINILRKNQAQRYKR